LNGEYEYTIVSNSSRIQGILNELPNLMGYRIRALSAKNYSFVCGFLCSRHCQSLERMSHDDTGDSVAIQLSDNMNGTIRNVFVYKAEYFVFLIELGRL